MKQSYNPALILVGKILDLFFFPLLLYRKFKKYPPLEKSQFNSILLVQSHKLGDVLMATPAIRAIKEKYPTACLYFWGNSFSKILLENNPALEGIITTSFPWGMKDYSVKNIIRFICDIYILRRQSFDLAIDLQCDFRNALAMMFLNSVRTLGIPLTGGKAFFTDLMEDEIKTPNMTIYRLEVLKALGIKALPEKNDFFLPGSVVKNHKIVIHPSAGHPSRVWPAAHMAKLIMMLPDEIIVIQGPKDRNLIEEIKRICGKDFPVFDGSLKEVASIFLGAKLIICMDSFAAHLAGATMVPTIVLCDKSLAEVVCPPYKNITPLQINRSIKELTPENVFQEVQRLYEC